MTGRTSPRTLDHIQMVQKKSPFASECHIENVLVILVVVVAHVLVQHTHNAPTVANRALDFIGKIYWEPQVSTRLFLFRCSTFSSSLMSSFFWPARPIREGYFPHCFRYQEYRNQVISVYLLYTYDFIVFPIVHRYSCAGFQLHFVSTIFVAICRRIGIVHECVVGRRIELTSAAWWFGSPAPVGEQITNWSLTYAVKTKSKVFLKWWIGTRHMGSVR